MGKIILCGGGGSGKDTLKQRLMDKGFKPEVSYTTRPIREGVEIPGETYHYIEESEFLKMIDNNEFLQHKNFRGWYYGTTRKEWETKDLYIMTPEGIADIPKEDRKNCFVIYLNIDEDIRRERLSIRNDADDVERRLNADRGQFAEFTDYDLILTNPNF